MPTKPPKPTTYDGLHPIRRRQATYGKAALTPRLTPRRYTEPSLALGLTDQQVAHLLEQLRKHPK